MRTHAPMPPPRAWYGSTFVLSLVVGLVLCRYLWLDTVEITRLQSLLDAVFRRAPADWSGLHRTSLVHKFVISGLSAGTIAVLAQMLYRRVRLG